LNQFSGRLERRAKKPNSMLKMPEIELKPCFLTPKKLRLGYPLFVYLPGMDGTGQLLRTQTAGLEMAFDVRCLVIPKQDMTNWDVLTQNVLNLIYAELAKGYQQVVYLCGESFGGCLAMKLAILAPHLFEYIVLINPASSFHLSPWFSWISQATNFVPAYFYPVGALALLPFLATLPRISPSVRYELLRTLRSIPSQTVNWRLSLLREFSIDLAKLQQLQQPVLLVAGDRDQLLPSRQEIERLMNVLPNSQTVILPESGHACLLEEDVNLYEILAAKGFLAKLSWEIPTSHPTPLFPLT
jgi:pimeloyl-ACP methyl ester carboxylesterase